LISLAKLVLIHLLFLSELADGRLAMTAAVREVFNQKPDEFDPRKYLGPAREALKTLYMHKNEEVLGSAQKA